LTLEKRSDLLDQSIEPRGPSMPVLNRVAALAAEIAAWRQDIHRHPELDYDVHRTSALVADKLRAFGCDEVVTGIGRSGVVARIKGHRGDGRTVALRADMDGLPIQEETGRPYASTVPGKMHACGHDGHTAMLLGAARHLAETRNFAGSAVLIFQPAEEGGGGGLAMVQDGMMERFGIDEVYGMHNWPGLPAGHFAIRPGPLLAAADRFAIEIEGRGAHAAQPYRAIDSVLVGSQIVVALQGIVARNVNPLDAAVLSVTVFKAGEAMNVIPQTASLKGTVRVLKEEVRALIEQRLRQVAEGIAAANGAKVRVGYTRGYPVTVNHAEQTAFAASAAAEIAGVENVDRSIDPVMGAEDFSYMLEARPGAMIFIGNGDSAGLHNPAYDFDDAIIPAGVSFWVKLTEQRLAR
jgi:amidohydrolase